MNEKNRIEKIILEKKMTSGQFAVEIGIQNSTLSHILNNRNNPSLDVLKKILNRFPDISSDWLILGQGSMFRQQKYSQGLTLFDEEDEVDYLSEDYADKNDLQNDNDFSDNQSELLESVNKNKEQTEMRDKTNHHFMNTEVVQNSQPALPRIEKIRPVIQEKKVKKIILYYSDNTFQEFESK